MSNEAKVEMVPMLQDMRTYITNHYWSEILCEVEEQLPGFKAQMPPWTQGTQLFLHHEESKIVKADFWRRSRTKMSADLYVRLKIGASKNGELPRYFVENMYLSTDFVLDGTIQWLSESTVLLDECPEREGWTKLSKYLVPIFSYDDMELQVQNMLKAYLGEIAVTAYQPRAAWKLAKAMELQISSAPLFKNRRTEAILFFQEGIARAERQVGDETVMEEMVVPAKTILLNSNAKSYQRADSDGREIFHECIHYGSCLASSRQGCALGGASSELWKHGCCIAASRTDVYGASILGGSGQSEHQSGGQNRACHLPDCTGKASLQRADSDAADLAGFTGGKGGIQLCERTVYCKLCV